MALMTEIRLPVIVNPEITKLPDDWENRVFGEFNFVVTDMALADPAMKAEAVLLLNEKLLEREALYDAV